MGLFVCLFVLLVIVGFGVSNSRLESCLGPRVSVSNLVSLGFLIGGIKIIQTA